MELLTQKENKKFSADQKSVELINKVKNLILSYDKNAGIILFGSRARGDWHEESDWDFLILTDLKVTETFKAEIRNKVLTEIEMLLDEQVFVLIKNKSVWEDDYAVTNIYESIAEEGIAV